MDTTTDQLCLRTILETYQYVKTYRFHEDEYANPDVARIQRNLDRFTHFVETVFYLDEDGALQFRPNFPLDVPNAVQTALSYKPFVDLLARRDAMMSS